MIAVGVGEVGRDAVGRLQRSRIFEPYTVGFERLEIFSAIISQEYPVITTAVGLRRRSGIDSIVTSYQDEFESLPFGCNCKPPRAALLLIVLAFLEAQNLSVELESSVLIPDHNGHVSSLLDQLVMPPVSFALGWISANWFPSGSLKYAEVPHVCF